MADYLDKRWEMVRERDFCNWHVREESNSMLDPVEKEKGWDTKRERERDKTDRDREREHQHHKLHIHVLYTYTLHTYIHALFFSGV